MKTSRFVVLAGLLSGSLLQAQAPLSPRSGATSYDSVIDFSYAGSSAIGEGTRPLGDITSSKFRASHVQAWPFNEQTKLLAGLGTQWLGFNPAAGSVVPESLVGAAVKLGVNHNFSPTWSMRVEADPGVYGEEFGNGGFDAPVAMRLIYVASRELQWAFALNVDWRGGTPIVGGVGLRWQFAPEWTLSLLVPAPRIEWAVLRNVTLFAGASLHGGTFQVADDFGRTRGRPALDGQWVDYREIGIGAGVRWHVTPATTLNVGVGRMLDRRFHFDDRNLLLNGDGAAAFQLALTSAY